MPVRFEARAIAQLDHIRDWLTDHADADTADRIVGAILDRCEGLAAFSDRGTPHDHIRPGLRTVPLRRRFVIGYRVHAEDVIILGVIGRGQMLGALVD